jgi:hypothetical protein
MFTILKNSEMISLSGLLIINIKFTKTDGFQAGMKKIFLSK